MQGADAQLSSTCPTQGQIEPEQMEEDLLESSKAESDIRIGDTICFQSASRSEYITLDEESKGISWHAKDDSCMFTIYPAIGQPYGAQKDMDRSIHDGDVVCLFAPNGYFLSFDGKRPAADRPYYVAGPSAEFIVHVGGDGVLRNRGKISLRNRASQVVLAVPSADMVDCDSAKHTLIPDTGCFMVERAFEKMPQIPRTPRKRTSLVKRRSRHVISKLPSYARRLDCHDRGYFCKPVHKRLLARPVSTVSLSPVHVIA
jgi:hypothetical protein